MKSPVPDDRAKIADTAALERIIGKTPPAIHLKVIDHLDETALRWIARSPLVFAGFGNGTGIAVTLGGGEPGFAEASRSELRLPLSHLDDAVLARPGLGLGALFLLPGIGETLRVNGRVASIDAGMAVMAVEECYVHCAKALIRSGFWSASPVKEVPEGTAEFVAASRFIALATIDADGGADLSPKGDPAGAMAQIGDGNLWFADRPGNRRVDSFRNIVAQPGIGAALLIPGSHDVAIVSGRAHLTTDETARSRFAVNGKIPLITVSVDAEIVRRRSAALERAALWPAVAVEGVDPAAMFVAHMKLNRNKGFGAKIASAAVAVPGLMRMGLERDYKSNLY